MHGTCKHCTFVLPPAGRGVVDWRAMAGADLVLDQQVRDWVVVPLTLCILLMMVLRQYATKVSRPAYMAHQAELKRHPKCYF